MLSLAIFRDVFPGLYALPKKINAWPADLWAGSRISSKMRKQTDAFSAYAQMHN